MDRGNPLSGVDLNFGNNRVHHRRRSFWMLYPQREGYY
jgi:hypothetical protein